MNIYYTSSKTPVKLEIKPFASGGEGEVFKLIPNSTQCAKIIFPAQRTVLKEDKIKFLIKNTANIVKSSRFLLCFPNDLLYDRKGAFVGFLMPLGFSQSILLYELVTTKIKKKLSSEWQQKYDRSTQIGIVNRLKLCTNIAIAIHQIHLTKSLVLVDFKPQNVLITSDGKVAILDLDSVQIANGKKVICPGKVATPEYSPKEAEILNASVDYIDETWDRFSLAVVFYELLFGIHPFASTSKGQYSNIATISEKIQNNLYVHGSKRSYLSIIPPPHKNFDLIPISLKNLFLLAFEGGSQSPLKRPSAEDWGKEITNELKKNISFNPIKTVSNSVPILDKQITTTTIQYPNKTGPNNNSYDYKVFFGIIIALTLFFFFTTRNNVNSSDRNVEALTVDSLVSAVADSATAIVDSSSLYVSEFGVGKGKCYFWTNYGEDGPITIFLDGKRIGKLGSHFTKGYEPLCGEEGTIGRIVQAGGLHKYKAVGETLIWEDFITINEGMCMPIHLSGPDNTTLNPSVEVVDSVAF